MATATNTTKTGAKKVALVTGANKGIGLETARQLGRLGYTVLLGAREAARGTAAAGALAAEGLDARFVQLDVTSEADRKAVAAHVAETFGRLDVLVNNAAVALDREYTSSDVPLDVLRQTYEVNFFAMIALTQQLLPLVRKSEAGRIVNLSSSLASLALHSDYESAIKDMKILAYDSSKTAVNAFTVHLAHDLRDTPIKVNAADPGWVKTDMGGSAAPLEIEDGAKTSVHLATLPADGPSGGFFHLDRRLPW